MATQNSHRYCVIMCGGVGSRFWPYSRENCPKQFIDFLGTGRSLLQMSYDRILPIVPKENILVVTNEKYAPLIREQLPDLLPENILLEPARRNTAPCIAWAAFHIAAIDPAASMIVTPSDHLITRENIFEDCVRRGFEFVEKNDALLTLGITPVRPETGYGYIQVGQEAEPGILKVKTFTEKPNLELAKVFLETGEFFWNSGIFLWRASTIIDALRKHDSDLTVRFDRGASDFGTPVRKPSYERISHHSLPTRLTMRLWRRLTMYMWNVSTSDGTISAHGAPFMTTRPRTSRTTWPRTAKCSPMTAPAIFSQSVILKNL